MGLSTTGVLFSSVTGSVGTVVECADKGVATFWGSDKGSAGLLEIGNISIGNGGMGMQGSWVPRTGPIGISKSVAALSTCIEGLSIGGLFS